MQEVKEKQRLKEAKRIIAYAAVVCLVSGIVHIRTLVEKIQLQKQMKAEMEFVQSHAGEF